MATEDSSDNIITTNNVQMIKPDYVDAVDPFALVGSDARLNQQAISPGAAKSRFISVVQQVAGTKVVSASVPDGSSFILATQTTNAQGNRVLQVVGRQVYIGSQTLTARMPEVISSSTYPHYDWAGALDVNGKSLVNQPGIAVWNTQVRNNSGFTQTIFIEVVTRYIVNNSDQASRN